MIIVGVVLDLIGKKKGIPRQRTLTMIPWLSSIESRYKPEPEQVAQRTAPFASHSEHRNLSPMFFSAKDKPVGFSIISSGMALS